MILSFGRAFFFEKLRRCPFLCGKKMNKYETILSRFSPKSLENFMLLSKGVGRVAPRAGDKAHLLAPVVRVNAIGRDVAEAVKAKCRPPAPSAGRAPPRRQPGALTRHQGLTFRRNFAEISVFFVSASYRDPKFRYFSIYFVSKFKIQQISTEIHRNSSKFTEISERNFVSGKHRDLTGKRNG